jgi:hypothetical protein
MDRFGCVQKKWIPIIFLILLLGGMFWSRALMSMTQGLWAIYALSRYKEISFKEPLFLWSILPLFLWLLGAYQQPFAPVNFDYLLTLAMYPATVLVVQQTNIHVQQNQWIKIWLGAALIGLLYPLGYYATHIVVANQAYGTGQSLPTFMDTDHVRFSIFLCSALLFLIYFPIYTKNLRAAFILFLTAVILFLSVRTGWAILIIFLLLFPLLTLKSILNLPFYKMVLGIALLFFLVVVSYELFPTIQQKIAYSIWDWKQFHPGNYNPNYSDGTRRAINFSAWKSITDANGSNTGWAGIPTVLRQSFSHYFNEAKTEFGWPFNQWLFWWMGSGCWGMIAFSVWLFYPVFVGLKKKNTAIVIWTIAIAISCLVETTLNYQYGVFLHIWPLALLWKKDTNAVRDNS